jgi:hypothetical protein
MLISGKGVTPQPVFLALWGVRLRKHPLWPAEHSNPKVKPHEGHRGTFYALHCAHMCLPLSKHFTHGAHFIHVHIDTDSSLVLTGQNQIANPESSENLILFLSLT